VASPLSRAAHAVVSALTPDRYEQPNQTVPLHDQPRQSLGGYLSGIGHDLDPRTLHGLLGDLTLLGSLALPAGAGMMARSQAQARAFNRAAAQIAREQGISHSRYIEALRDPSSNVTMGSNVWIEGRPLTQRAALKMYMGQQRVVDRPLADPRQAVAGAAINPSQRYEALLNSLRHNIGNLMDRPVGPIAGPEELQQMIVRILRGEG
jgi:hypothetical protein